MAQNVPMIVLNQSMKREHGRKVQLENIAAVKAVSDIVESCLGPKAMLKMLLDPMGGSVITNDGNAILREIIVQHPAAKSIIEISRTQDESVGDGTTSVVILAGEILSSLRPFLMENMHPNLLIRALRLALDDILNILQNLGFLVNFKNIDEFRKVINSCLATKFSSNWGDLVCNLAIDSINIVAIEHQNNHKEVDIKKYVKVEKIPGGSVENSQVIRGIVLNKDVVHPSMSRFIQNPRIILMDCNLEYKKGESMTNVELCNDIDFNKLLKYEEDSIKQMCETIIKLKPNVLFTEKGVSDLAQYFLAKAGISVIRRIKKTDNNRLARACGATIVNQPEDLKEEHIGTGAGIFRITKIGDEYFTFIEECKSPKACSIILRGPSKDVLNEIERNLHDALCVARNIAIDPFIVGGGGAAEMAIIRELEKKAKTESGQLQSPYRALIKSLEIIPRLLIQNCGGNPIRTLTKLRADQVNNDPKSLLGIDGNTGKCVNVFNHGIIDCLSVRKQCFKSAFEVSIMLIKIDEIVSGSKKSTDLEKPSNNQAQPTEESQAD